MSNQGDVSVLNGAVYPVTSSIDLIERVLEKTRSYCKRLYAGNPGSTISSSWLKIGWTLFREKELVTLKTALNAKLASLTLLLTAANM